MKVFYVKNWDTDATITEVTDLAIAKKHCRDMGHTDWHDGEYYAPVAWVSDGDGNCIYNPKFKVKG